MYPYSLSSYQVHPFESHLVIEILLQILINLLQDAAADVVEFEDEVVEVQKAPPPRSEPAVEVRPAGRSASGAGAADPVQASSGRVLQYSKKKGGSGLLGDDLGQMSGGKKWLLVLLAVAAGGGVVYAIMTAMR